MRSRFGWLTRPLAGSENPAVMPSIQPPILIDPATGKKNIIMTGLWTEVCVTWPTIEMLGAGYNIYVVEDCCGATSPAAQEAALSRMVQAGAVRLAHRARHIEAVERRAPLGDRIDMRRPQHRMAVGLEAFLHLFGDLQPFLPAARPA